MRWATRVEVLAVAAEVVLPIAEEAHHDGPIVTQRAVPVGVRVLQTVLVAGVVVELLWLLLEPGTENAFRDLYFFTSLLIIAVVLFAWKAIWSRHDRWAWACMAIGLAIWSVADVYYTAVIALMDEAPYPSVADWTYLIFYPFACVAAILLLRTRVRRPPLKVWMDALLVALGVAAYIWLAGPQLFADPEASPAANFMNIANPGSDLILMCLLIGILGVMGWRADAMWWLLFAGAIVLWLTDTAWMLGVAESSYDVGAIIDFGWPAAFCLMSFAAWQKDSPPIQPDVGLRAAMVPLVVTGFALALLLYGTQEHIDLAPALLASCAIVVGAIRSSQAFKQASVQAETHRQAHTDDLTGLANRRLMDQRLAEVLDVRSLNQQDSCALLLIDVDSFKEINDSLGHNAGDAVLQLVGKRLQDLLRPSDTVARLGGDEFAILLGGGTTVSGAVAVAERIRSESAVPLAIGPMDLQVAMSIGIAMCPDHARTREDLLRAADAAMYRAKRSRCGYAVYEPGEDVEDRGRLLLTHELRAAVSHDELVCDFQPKINVETGEVIDIEALIRWRHPHLGMLYPASFLPVAERAGLMPQLTTRVLEVALDQAALWRSEGLPSNVGVNLSVTNLMDQSLPSTISDLLMAHGIPAQTLTLEITETVLITDPDLVHYVVGELHDIGVIISIDDYGTGYSSLAQLRRLKAQELKLDHSLVTGLAHRSDIRSIVHATVELAHDLGLRMVAEGVESAEDLTELRALNCDLAQGYYICEPGPPDKITAWLRAHTNRELPTQRGRRDSELPRELNS